MQTKDKQKDLSRFAQPEAPHASHPMRELLTERHVAGVLRVSVKALQAWRLRGGGPPFIKLGRCVRYRLEDLEAFIASARRHSTSDRGQDPRHSQPRADSWASKRPS